MNCGSNPFVTEGAVAFEITRWQVTEGRINISADFPNQTYHFD